MTRYGWKWGFVLVTVSLVSLALAAFGAGWTWDDTLSLWLP